MKRSYRALSFVTAGSAAFVSLLAYPFLPDRVPTHFGADGRPDPYRSREIAAFSGPTLMAALAILNERVGSWLGGADREDADSGTRARNEAIDVALLGLMLNHLALLAKGLSLPVDIERVRRAVYGLVLVALGNVLPKVPRNAFVGVRTPWTMSDPAVWERTHRVTGYLCVLAGLVILASASTRGKFAQAIPGVMTVAIAGLGAAYSWRAPRTSGARG